MNHGFIIVERDRQLRDLGVFTGLINMGDAGRRRVGWEGEDKTFAMMHATSSPDLEDAFVFNWSAQAWHFAHSFEWWWDEASQRYEMPMCRWVVRRDGEFRPGEYPSFPAVPRVGERLIFKMMELS